jgi:isopentenyl diphosphate isomerase/L-lactate dehydrogenase-like FMN-dependent dehydrogenase
MQEDLQYAVLHEFVAPAKRNLSHQTWDYLMGGAETETTYIRNRVAIDSVAFRPRVLRDVEKVDTGGTLLGQRMRIPVILAPIGSLQDIVAEGGLAPTKAAARFGIMHMLSSVCSPGQKTVAAAVEHPKIFQLYVRGDRGWVDDQVAQAVANGYVGVCLTVDLDY